MKRMIILVTSALLSFPISAQTSLLQKEDQTTRLVVDGNPFIVLGGELGNSSAACT